MVNADSQEKKQVLAVIPEDYLAMAVRLALTFDSQYPLNTQIFSTGEQALQIDLNGTYDLIICRAELPDMGNYEFLRQARQQGCTTPAIIISKNGQDTVSEALMAELGIQAVITEPFCAQAFIAKVHQLIQGEEKTSMKNENNLEEIFVLPRKSILILDDDLGLCRIYAKALSKSNYMVCIANTMEEAQSFLETHAFDIFICDIHVGRKRGTELLKEYRQKFTEDNTYVIMVSAYGQYRQMTEEFGADFFLEKPISLGTLLTIIGRLLDYSENDEQEPGESGNNTPGPKAKIEIKESEENNLFTGSY